MNAGVTREHAQAAKAHAADTFRPLVGDVAVGLVRLGEDRFGLKVNLKKAPAKGVELPVEVDGVPVRVEVVGRIRKRGS